MIDDAYQELHALEAEHFWYVGARAVYRTLLQLGLGAPTGQARILEVGSGTGGNLEFLETYGPTVGLEYSSLALRLTPHPPKIGLLQGSADALPFPANTFDAVALFGLIEHMEDDVRTLQEAARVCKKGGAVTLLTSAFPFLWSHHDEANRHQRRYYRAELLQTLARAGLTPVRVSYQNFFTFGPTLLARLWQRRQVQEPRYDMGLPPRWANSLLIGLLRLEAWLIRFFPLPVGVDLVAVARPKRDEP
jgi:SAM-dependent methyltransferase